ncbi:transcription termination/antitermination protein NusG [Thermopirellula anaerolimosa]
MNWTRFGGLDFMAVDPENPSNLEGFEPQADSVPESGDAADRTAPTAEGGRKNVDAAESETPEAEAARDDESDAAASDSGDDEIPPKEWYILKVQTNREDTVREALLRRIKIAGMDKYFGDIIVPVEKVTEYKGGRKRVLRRKLYPGYIVVQMALTEDAWFMVRETPGIGDFTGAIGRPTPMLPHEVSRILAKAAEEKAQEAPRLKIGCNVGDRVKINDGPFATFEGEVSSIDEANGRVTVVISIFGRSTPVVLEYWQVERIA